MHSQQATWLPALRPAAAHLGQGLTVDAAVLAAGLAAQPVAAALLDLRLRPIQRQAQEGGQRDQVGLSEGAAALRQSPGLRASVVLGAEAGAWWGLGVSGGNCPGLTTCQGRQAGNGQASVRGCHALPTSRRP